MEPNAGADVDVDEQKKFELLWHAYAHQLEEQKKCDDESLEVCPDPSMVMKVSTSAQDALKLFKAIFIPPLSAAAAAASSPLNIVQPPVQMPTPPEFAQVTKVFINFCVSDLIAAPVQEKVESEDELKLRIPLSCGPPRIETDKGQSPCVVFDVIFNPIPVKLCQTDPNQLAMLSQFAAENIMQKYKVTLSSDFKYPKLKYKGQGRPPGQRIRKPPSAQKTLIEDVSNLPTTATKTTTPTTTTTPSKAPANKANNNAEQSNDDSNNKKDKEKNQDEDEDKDQQNGGENESENRRENSNTASPKPDAKAVDSRIIPKYVAWCLDATGAELPCEDRAQLPVSLHIAVELPGVASVSEIDMAISSVDVVLKGLGNTNPVGRYFLHYQFPFVVNEEEVEATFVKKKQKLILKLPIQDHAPSSLFWSLNKQNVLPFQHLLQFKNKVMFELCE